MITKQDRQAIRRIYRKIEDGVTASSQRQAEQLGVPLTDDMRKINVAQNALRVCLEEVINEICPVGELVFAELAARVACYLISATPIERQLGVMQAVQASLPEALASRQAQGIVLRTAWSRDGSDPRPNFPEGRQ